MTEPIHLDYYATRCLRLLHSRPMARIEMTDPSGATMSNEDSAPAVARLEQLGLVKFDDLVPSKWQITPEGVNFLAGLDVSNVADNAPPGPVTEEKVGAAEIARQVKLTRFDAVHFLQNTREVSAYLAEFLEDDPDGPGVSVELLRSVIDDAVRALDSIHAGETMVKILQEQHARLNAESAEGLHQ